MGMAMDMGMAMVLRHKFYLAGWLLPLGIGLAFPALAGEWKITPSVSVQETATDNVGLNQERKSDWVTDVTPGISIHGKGGRASLDFDYRLHNLYYAKDSSRNNTQNLLNARGTVEALENWLFIDAAASIAQQNVSAFRGSVNNTVATSDGGNTTETSSYRLSPYIKGELGSFAEYQLRYNYNTSRSGSSNVSDTDTREWTARLAGLAPMAQLGWALDGSVSRSDYSTGRGNEADSLRGVLTWHYDPQFRLLLIAGRESNDYLSVNKESHTIKGFGFEWSPTERTSLTARREDRFFGNNNNISFSHRTAGTVWKFSQSKDASVSTGQNRAGSAGTYYDLFYSMFASAIPDPVARSAYVNALLLNSGISPVAQMQGGFLSSGVSLQKRRELSFALLGVRNTVTFAATQSDSGSLSQGSGSGVTTGTDFANVNNVRQDGVSMNWSHKLTGLSTLTGSAAHLRSKGRGGASLATDETMYSLNFLTQLGPKTHAGLGARRVMTDGSTSYTENALTGSLSHQF